MEELNSDYPIYFSKNDKNTEKLRLIKKIIKDQYNVTCRCQIDKDHILESLEDFGHGFILLNRKQPKYGDKKGRKDLYYLKSFILFNYNKFNKIITELVVCSVKTISEIGNGRRLMDSVFKFGYENDAILWELKSLPYDKLLEYYQKLGFIFVDTIYYNGKKKIYRMEYTFTEENKNIFYTWLSKYRLTNDDYNISFKVSNSPITHSYETKNDKIIQGMLLFINMYNETSKYNTIEGETISYQLNSELLNYVTEEQIGYISEYETKNKMKIMLKGNLEMDEYNIYYDLEMKDRHSLIFIMINSEMLSDYEEYLEGIEIMATFFKYQIKLL